MLLRTHPGGITHSRNGVVLNEDGGHVLDESGRIDQGPPPRPGPEFLGSPSIDDIDD
ncbi:hypothetical protein [Glycomyces tarimensis]